MFKFLLAVTVVSTMAIGCTSIKTHTVSPKVGSHMYTKNDTSDQKKRLDNHNIQKNINPSMIHQPIHNVTPQVTNEGDSYKHLPSRMLWIKSPNGKWNIRIKRD
jgi:uncharacterized protein YceK